MNINLTLIGQSITFIIFDWFCYKLIWPVLLEAMRERQKTIADGLEAAERAEKDLELAEDRVAEQLREARDEAQEILDMARAQASQMSEQAKQDARDENERVKEAATAEIEQEINRAKEVLRGQGAGLALQGAERVLGASIDPGSHRALLEKLATEL